MSGVSLRSILTKADPMDVSTDMAEAGSPIFSLPPTPRHGAITVRPWSKDLAPSVAVAANNRAIWLNLRDRMPYPYTLSDAEWYIGHCSQPENWPNVLSFDERGVETIGERRSAHFAIVAVNPGTGEDEAIGSIGLVMGVDVARRSAELGYWLAERYWGKGIMGDVVAGFMSWVWVAFPGLVRVHSGLFARNERSAAVLRKNGFVFEGRHRAAVWKNGKLEDELAYARLRPGLES